MSTRRHVLQLLAAAPALSACGGGDLPDPIAAWRDPGAGEQDPRRFALAHAILAPNPHNTQAWQVELRGDDEMLLYCDLERRLPFTDPNDRQITIGCGCFGNVSKHTSRTTGRWRGWRRKRVTAMSTYAGFAGANWAAVPCTRSPICGCAVRQKCFPHPRGPSKTWRRRWVITIPSFSRMRSPNGLAGGHPSTGARNKARPGAAGDEQDSPLKSRSMKHEPGGFSFDASADCGPEH